MRPTPEVRRKRVAATVRGFPTGGFYRDHEPRVNSNREFTAGYRSIPALALRPRLRRGLHRRSAGVRTPTFSFAGLSSPELTVHFEESQQVGGRDAVGKKRPFWDR